MEEVEVIDTGFGLRVGSLSRERTINGKFDSGLPYGEVSSMILNIFSEIDDSEMNKIITDYKYKVLADIFRTTSLFQNKALKCFETQDSKQILKDLEDFILMDLDDSVKVNLDDSDKVDLDDSVENSSKYSAQNFFESLPSTGYIYLIHPIRNISPQPNGRSDMQLLKTIFDLLSAEMNNEIKTDSHTFMDTASCLTISDSIEAKNYYVPTFLEHKELIDSMKHSLLEKDVLFNDDLKDYFKNINISSSLTIYEDNSIHTVYHFTNILALLLLDLHKYQNSEETIRRCQRCGRLFLPTSKKNRTYCTLPNPKGKTCADLAKRKQTELQMICARARANQYSLYQNACNLNEKKYKGNLSSDSPPKPYNKMIRKHYEGWQNCMSCKYREYKDCADFAELKTWISETRLVIDNLLKLGFVSRITNPSKSTPHNKKRKTSN